MIEFANHDNVEKKTFELIINIWPYQKFQASKFTTKGSSQ